MAQTSGSSDGGDGSASGVVSGGLEVADRGIGEGGRTVKLEVSKPHTQLQLPTTNCDGGDQTEQNVGNPCNECYHFYGQKGHMCTVYYKDSASISQMR